MKHNDYFGNLPKDVRKNLNSITGDYFEDWKAIEYFLNKAERQIGRRYEISVALLGALDLIEIADQPSMVRPQRKEFAWEVSMRYFSVLAKLLNTAIKKSDAVENEETAPFLIMKMRYELKKRRKVIEYGGSHELEKILRPIRHLIHLCN